MKRIILDTNIILRAPEILSLTSKGIELIIPEPVIYELSNSEDKGHVSSYLNILQKSINAKNAHIVSFDNQKLASVIPNDLISMGRLSAIDRIVLAYTTILKMQYSTDEIILATDDKALSQTAMQLGIKVFIGDKLLKELLQMGTQDQSLKKDARQAKTKQLTRTILSATIGAGLTLLANYAYTNLNMILPTIKIGGTIAAIPILALVLFWIRSHYRLAYGITEVGVGCLAAIRVFWPSFDYAVLNAPSIIQFFGGLYVMVRGFDNLGKGLKGSRLFILWSNWFPD
jgi:rRNA-processing protein FCF1